MVFEFATATRIVFGPGKITELPALAKLHGHKVLWVTGEHPERQEPIRQTLQEAGFQTVLFSIRGEPCVTQIREGVRVASEAGCELVISIGGGSVVDAGKALAALVTQPEDVMRYLEVVGRGQPLTKPSLPFIAIPTPAVTGAEVTRNAVLASPEHGVKASLRHASMLPAVALIDPVLACDCPPAVTAASGMDALTQCLEAYVSCRAQAMTDALCLAGIERAVRSLEKAVTQGQDVSAREDMALAAMFSGMALANAGLGAVHGFAAPIGGTFKAPHGAVCAALLAPVWRANLEALRARDDAAEALRRFETAGQLLTQNAQATDAEVCDWLQQLTARLEIPGLARHGIQRTDFDGIATQAMQASSMKGNPVTLTHATLMSILESAL
jgi:alcohol dehydrogenase class IV